MEIIINTKADTLNMIASFNVKRCKNDNKYRIDSCNSVVGLDVGLDVGVADGLNDGVADGLDDGVAVGLDIGVAVGLDVGINDGLPVGDCVGREE